MKIKRREGKNSFESKYFSFALLSSSSSFSCRFFFDFLNVSKIYFKYSIRKNILIPLNFQVNTFFRRKILLFSFICCHTHEINKKKDTVEENGYIFLGWGAKNGESKLNKRTQKNDTTIFFFVSQWKHVKIILSM